MAEKLEKKRLFSQKVIALIILVVVLGVIVYFGLRTLDIGNPVVALVNDEKITARELSTRYAQLPEEYADALTEEDFLQELIDVRLLIQEAKAQGIVVRDEELDASLALLEQQLPEGTELDAFLGEQGLTKDDLRSDLTDQLLINKLINSTILSSLVVADEEVLEFYNSHIDEFIVDGEPIPLEQLADPIRQQIVFEQTNVAVTLYLSQLRASSEIVLGDSKQDDAFAGFVEVGDVSCAEEGRLLLHVFTTSSCESCGWVEPALVRAFDAFDDGVAVRRWELDTGDDLATEAVETGVSKEALVLFKAFNKDGKIPFYLFGCRYARTGNVYTSLVQEEQGFRRVISALMNDG